MKKFLFSGPLVFILVAVIFTGFTASGFASEEVIRLKATYFLPGFMDICKDFVELTNRINQRAEGKLEIKVMGGPEVIPPLEQADALRRGVIDCLMCPTEFYKPNLPEATVFHLSMLTPAEERESGFYDFMVERHAKFGIFYAGRTRAYDPFFIYTKKKLSKLEDFSGKKIGRESPLCVPFLKALGATVVTLKTPDYYNALERGVVDGVGHPSDGMTGLSLPEVAEYYIATPFYLRNSTVFLINLEKYNRLPPKLKKIIMDTTIEWENERVNIDRARVASELSIGEQKGIQPLHLSPEDAQKYVDLSYQVEWDIIKDRLPDLYPTLKKLLKQ